MRVRPETKARPGRFLSTGRGIVHFLHNVASDADGRLVLIGVIAIPVLPPP